MTDKKKAVSLHSKSVGLVAQLDRVPDYGSGGCGFDSRPVHKRKSRNRFPFFFLYSSQIIRIYTNLFSIPINITIHSRYKKGALLPCASTHISIDLLLYKLLSYYPIVCFYSYEVNSRIQIRHIHCQTFLAS